MIPDFNPDGVLPPLLLGRSGDEQERSPYHVDMLTFCQRFGTSVERRVLLRGLLGLREELHKAGLGGGFQWINGSFTEDVELLRGRPPQDIDVVTFAPVGDLERQRTLLREHPSFFTPQSKRDYGVDHQWVTTDKPVTTSYAQRIAYWYSMWSHQSNTHLWKGFVVILTDSTDDEATLWLDAQDAAGDIG